MFGSNLKSKLFVFAVITGIFFTFGTCESPMGLGKSIDFEAPVLTIDPVGNPLYVRLGTTLSGTVTDNTSVSSVIMRDAATGNTLFNAELTGNRWKMSLSFSESQNGEKIMAEIVAYDNAKNSGSSSIATVTLIVDIRPPVVEDIMITRTPTKIAFLETYNDLKKLETSDPRGELSDNVDKYQNGWFYIDGKVSEEETRIEVVSLNIYDARKPDTLLVSLPLEKDSSKYSPRWLVTEEDIIEAGEAVFGDYRTNYYNNNERYYYRVAITAIDRSENETDFTEDKGFFCMWKKGDEPKGIFEPAMGTVITRGTPLPVEFFDDDQLAWAYAGLFTKDQWDGDKPVASGTYISGNKLEWLKERLLNRDPVYNWRYDKYSDTSESAAMLKELIGSASVSDKFIYVSTGNLESDYGDFVLVTLAGDKKLDPHDGSGLNDWKGRSWDIQIIDDNAPVIVFDTKSTSDSMPGAATGGSPEENTFPKLTDGRYFELNGYTLRENTSGLNTVGILRMAWIPYGMEGGPDAYIQKVESALSSNNYPNDFDSIVGLAGVQHWEFYDENYHTNGDIKLIEGTPEPIGGSSFKKQVFRKRFDVLGGVDDTKPEYRNFTYDKNGNGILEEGERENNTKLFVLCAIDNTGRPVYKQMRLLGMKNAPILAVYDISTKSVALPVSPSLPDIYEDNPNGDFTEAYADRLRDYNNRSDVYNALKAVSIPLGSLIPTIPFQTYTRGTELKYWIMAERSGDLAVADIKMEDITNERGAIAMGSEFNETDRAVSFIEYFPDVTSRVFRFTATDTLGNPAVIQRTVAITNAAFLRDITTTAQNGSYGIGQPITLQANFTSPIRIVTGAGGKKPELNVRYQVSGEAGYKIASIECNEDPGNEVLSLTFDFEVQEGFIGRLETMYESSSMTGTYVGADSTHKERPIRLLNGAGIIDVSRNEPAFVPGYVVGSSVSSSWTTDSGSLQSSKTSILLDGQRPRINDLDVSGKTIDSGNYYFKADEIINFIFTADKPIRAEGTPKLNFVIKNLSGDVEYDSAENGNINFTYQRPQGNNGMVFSLNTKDIPPFTGYGKLDSVSFVQGSGKIVDDVGNDIVDSTVSMSYLDSTNVYIKTSKPAAPVTTIGGNNVGYYQYPPALEISDPNLALEPWGVTKQYSLNDGYTWIEFPKEQAENPAWTNIDEADGNKLKILNGEWNLQTRYVDKAGNQGEPFALAVRVNQKFPRLESVSMVEPAGTYIAGDTLHFTLNFAEEVSEGSVSITIKDRSDSADASAVQELTKQVSANTDTINIDWTILSGKQMNNGLYIAEINLTGLKDRFGNSGGDSVSSNVTTITMPADTNYTVNNLPSGIIVDAVLPTVTLMTPAIGAVSTDNKTIILTFSENVMVGSGTITVRPKAGYAIPPVFEDAGYWLGTDGTRYSVPGGNTTYIPSFREIFDKVDDDQKMALAGGTNFSSLPTKAANERTGQSAGPYKKMTHGLIAGNGYSGNYIGTGVQSGANAPDISTGNGYMVPDTATKWVLDYQYGINQDIAAVNDIRAALTAAKFRWQEIDAGSAVITGSVVTITLNEPLLKGLDWEVYYPAGAFTDIAGNPAVGQGYTGSIDSQTMSSTSNYWFESSGVQPPVIRVNRRSFDARNSNWASSTNRTYGVPGDTADWDTNTIVVTDNNGWGINDFNAVHYRVESETPGATVKASVLRGTNADNSSVTAAWTGNVQTANAGSNFDTRPNRDWNATAASTGEWILPNLIRRAGAGRSNANSYTVRTKNGTETRNFNNTNNATYNGFRSYNKDLTTGDIEGTTPSVNVPVGGQGVITFGAMEASKNYVIGSATRNGATEKGYEGVFRTVIALLSNANRTNNQASVSPNLVYVEGSNIKNGMPSIAGFPVRDAEETGDNRYVKAFYSESQQRYYWVSTEIVCEWYFLSWGYGGAHMSGGEVNNYLTVGYGDLTYGYNISSY